MSTIKISQLSALPSIATNTSNTLLLGVNTQTGATGNFTVTSLSQQLFANNYLAVGTNITQLPSTIGQFQSSDLNTLQVNVLNTNVNGSAAYTASADTTNGANSFISVGITNSRYANSMWSAVRPYDGIMYVRGPTTTSYTGNLILSAASANANVAFLVGGTTTSNVVSVMSKNGLMMLNGSYVTFADGTTISTAPALLAYSQASYALANTNAAQLVYVASVDNTQNTNISATDGKMQSAYNLANSAAALLTYQSNVDLTQNSWIISTNSFATSAYGQANAATITAAQAFIQANGANSYAYSAFTKANNALANTSGVITAGDLTVSGSITVNGTMILANSNFNPTAAALTISATSTVATPANDGYMIHISGKNGVPSRIVTDSYGTGAYGVYASRAARGTVSAPSAVQAGDIIARFSGNGYGTTKFQQFGTGRIDFVASENYTDTATGSQIQFWNCPTGSNTLVNIASFNGANVTFSGAIYPQKGFIYNPSIYPGTQTAITIDITANTLVKAQTSSGLTVTLTNFYAGKIVDLWVTNTSGGNQTFTHGVSATNSTTNSTTYTIPGTSTIKAQYVCFDGTLANTCVAITHA